MITNPIKVSKSICGIIYRQHEAQNFLLYDGRPETDDRVFVIGLRSIFRVIVNLWHATNHENVIARPQAEAIPTSGVGRYAAPPAARSDI